MRVLVAVKRVVDPDVRVRVKADGTGVDIQGLKMSLNPFDENAVEEAVRLKEAGVATEVIAVSVGGEVCRDTLRTALAMGADRAILITTDLDPQPLAVAKLLAATVRRERVDLLFTGKQAIDGDDNQVGQATAALLGWGQGTFASKVVPGDGVVTVTREVDDGLETVELKLPAVLTADLRLNEPRYASLPNIMRAKKKPVDTLTPAELGVDPAPRLVTVSVREPAPRAPGVKLPDAAALVAALRDARVL